MGVILATGCSDNETRNLERTTSGSAVKEGKKIPQGITFNKIKFETINKNDVPKEFYEKIEQVKKNKGYIYMADDKSGYIYIAVFMGEKPTGGYSIEVTDIGDSEGRTGVTVKEVVPQKDALVTQALTQPYTIIRAKGITTNITVRSAEGEVFKQL